MGAIDANGVYIYDESDPVSPFSDFMNLGQSAQSVVLGDADARLTALETEPVWSSVGMAFRPGWQAYSATDLLRYKAFPAMGLVYTAPVLIKPTSNLTGLTSGVSVVTVTGARFDPLAGVAPRGNYAVCTHTGTGSETCSLSTQNLGSDHVWSIAFDGTTALSASQYIGIPGMWWVMTS
ncbi:hypothetical protein [Cellulosimicrobium cellulans]|uniref:hypothetical protein n=1 Tax=Cellulosimicrobium cellulans TaxID=1710 RepID=UPI001BA7EB27|nr:hypothetical protein [Cellulosimicrobium cellulans]QUC01096.1 hypothetical protein J5A69_07980 [Cellulosimicrobium cellulans]